MVGRVQDVECLVSEVVPEIVHLTPDATQELIVGQNSIFVHIEDFEHHFADWTFDWLDVPALLRGAVEAYENPMIDRDPVPTWRDGPVALMGDAAHAMYPTGSNGASQAVIDARTLGKHMLVHGATAKALAAYDAELCAPVSQLILRNRGAGPFGLLNIVDERCGGTFENIDDVISPQERTEFMAGYKAAAGFAIDQLNAAPQTISSAATVAGFEVKAEA